MRCCRSLRFLGALAAVSSLFFLFGSGSEWWIDGTTLDAVDVPIDAVTHDELPLQRGDSFSISRAARKVTVSDRSTPNRVAAPVTRTPCAVPGWFKKMSVVEADGITAAPSADQQQKASLRRHGAPFVTAGATRPILAPDDKRRSR